jgi:hypothetical protein
VAVAVRRERPRLGGAPNGLGHGGERIERALVRGRPCQGAPFRERRKADDDDICVDARYRQAELKTPA